MADELVDVSPLWVEISSDEMMFLPHHGFHCRAGALTNVLALRWKCGVRSCGGSSGADEYLLPFTCASAKRPGRTCLSTNTNIRCRPTANRQKAVRVSLVERSVVLSSSFYVAFVR